MGGRAIALTSAAATLTGCGVFVASPAVIDRAGEPVGPLTPEQSRVQVLEAATEIVAQLRIPVAGAYFWRAACDDAGGPPLRGEIRISYPRAPDDEASRAQIEAMIHRLGDTGWTADPTFRSHSRAIRKAGVIGVFQAQNPSVKNRNIMVLGECRDTTPKDPAVESVEAISLR